MKEEDQKIAIARQCGMTEAQINAAIIVEKARKEYGNTRRDSFSRWDAISALEKAEDNPDFYCDIPNYPSDLNAMYEAKKILHKDEILWAKYRDEIHKFYLINDTFSPSARNEAEAFLRTLNVWKD